MAKTEEDLKQSREVREEVIRKYGCVPTSVWKIDYSKNELIADTERTQASVAHTDEKLYARNDLQKAFSSSGRSVRGKSGGLSLFPYELAEKILKFWSVEGDNVLDPTMGHATRMTVCYHFNRNYTGYDVSKEFIALNEKIKENLLGLSNQKTLFTNKSTITIRNQSSEKMVENDETIDLIFTSPPYWDTEFYGEEPEQLGYKKTYTQFLDGIKRVMSECFRVLKKDKYCCFNINDFRKDGIFIDYHNDICRIGKEIGFKIHDIVIVEWINCIGQCFASQIEDRKYTAKKHEYLIVFKK